MSNLKIEYKEIVDLNVYEKNARTHGLKQIRQIANSIEEFGFTNPILVDGDKGVIAGHGRLYACKLLGIKKVPCIELSHLTEDQKRAYVIADNQIALGADWDFDILKEEMARLDEVDFDIKLTGFDDIDSISENQVGDKEPSQDTSPQDIDSKFSVIVDCEDEADQEAIFKLMTSKGYKCKVLSV